MRVSQPLLVLAAALASSLPLAFASPVAPRSFGGVQISGCDVSKTTLPPSSLAPPDPGTSPVAVLLGRGTQNYTCADGNDSTIPTARGAEAILLDVSCLATQDPGLLHALPDLLVQMKYSVLYYTGMMFQRLSDDDLVVGHHYFAPDFSTPIFDLRSSKKKIYFSGKKDGNVPALTTASTGAEGEKNGAVDWLRIKADSRSVGAKLAYRIYTAGGKPPGNCKGREKFFTVQYATEYCLSPPNPFPLPIS